MAPRFAYLHGFASSSLSTKGQALRRFFAGRGLTMHTPELNHPSFAALTYSGMLEAFDRLDRELSEAELASGQEQPSRWRLIGSSMGGFVASRWAELHPERVERLLLLCPAFDFCERWPGLIGAEAFERWEQQGSFPLPGPGGRVEEVHFGLVEDARDNHPARPLVPCPTLIIHGRRDTVVPFESSASYAGEHPDRVELHEVDDDHLLAASLPIIEARAVDFLIHPTRTLYWDYFGPDAAGTAEHFRVHLDEFLLREALQGCTTGVEVSAPGRAAAWCRCPESILDVIGRALRPRRVQ